MSHTNTELTPSHWRGREYAHRPLTPRLCQTGKRQPAWAGQEQWRHFSAHQLHEVTPYTQWNRMNEQRRNMLGKGVPGFIWRCCCLQRRLLQHPLQFSMAGNANNIVSVSLCLYCVTWSVTSSLQPTVWKGRHARLMPLQMDSSERKSLKMYTNNMAWATRYTAKKYKVLLRRLYCD